MIWRYWKGTLEYSEDGGKTWIAEDPQPQAEFSGTVGFQRITTPEGDIFLVTQAKKGGPAIRQGAGGAAAEKPANWPAGWAYPLQKTDQWGKSQPDWATTLAWLKYLQAQPKEPKPIWAEEPPTGYRWQLGAGGKWGIVADAPEGPQTLDQAIYQALLANDQATLDSLLAFQDRITPYQEAQFREGQAQFGATLGQRQAEERRRQLEWDMQFGATQQQRDVAQQQWQVEFGQGQYQFERTQAQRELEANRQHQLAALQMGLDIQRSPGDWWAYWNMLGSREPAVPYTPGEKVPRTWAEQWAQFGGQAPGPAGAFPGPVPAPGAQQFQPPTLTPTAGPAATPYAPPGFGDPEQVKKWLADQGITPEGGPPTFEGAPTPADMPSFEEMKAMQAQGYVLMYKREGGLYDWAAPELVGGYMASGWVPAPPYEEIAAPAPPPAPPNFGGPGQNLTPEQVAQQMSDQDREFWQKGYVKMRDTAGTEQYVAGADWNKAMGLGWEYIPWPEELVGKAPTLPVPVSGQATTTRIPQLVAPQTRAAGTFAFPGLPPQGWTAPRMEAAFRGQPIGAARQLPSLGAPVFPSGQSWGRLAPSEQQAFRGEVETQGFPWPDYMSQWEKTRPTWGTKVPFLRRPARLGGI